MTPSEHKNPTQRTKSTMRFTTAKAKFESKFDGLALKEIQAKGPSKMHLERIKDELTALAEELGMRDFAQTLGTTAEVDLVGVLQQKANQPHLVNAMRGIPRNKTTTAFKHILSSILKKTIKPLRKDESEPQQKLSNS